MSDTALRARSVTEIVDAAFKLYSRNVGQYVMVSAIAYSPALIATLILRPGDVANLTTDPASAGKWFLGYMLTMVISIVAMAFMNGIVTAFGSHAYLGEEVDVGMAVREAFPRVPMLLLSAVVMGFIYMIGLLLLVFPFFYFAALLFAVVPVVVLERRGVFGALDRSSQLSKGRKWHILGTLLMVYAIYIFGSIAITMVFAFTQNFLLLTLASTLYTIIAFPIVGLATMVLYYDMRIRGEGFDLERMTQQLGGAGAPTGPAFS